ncbi:MAG: hypothetical protein QM537_05615 [Candidatus Symbiobacter sp.]|nr:hypothetical protein [Candidatus Symbiobacter sp.]
MRTGNMTVAERMPNRVAIDAVQKQFRRVTGMQVRVVSTDSGIEIRPDWGISNLGSPIEINQAILRGILSMRVRRGISRQASDLYAMREHNFSVGAPRRARHLKTRGTSRFVKQVKVMEKSYEENSRTELAKLVMRPETVAAIEREINRKVTKRISLEELESRVRHDAAR